jgi:methyltransferase-like protein
MTQYEMNQANLDRLANPVLEYSDRRLGLTLADIARQAELEQETKRETAREERVDDRNRKAKLLELASRGIKLPDSASNRDISEAILDSSKKRAKAVIGIFRKERADNESEQDATYDKYSKLVSRAASVESKKQALVQMLSNPVVLAELDKKQVAKLRSAIAAEGDAKSVNATIDSAVSEVVNYVRDDYWRSSKGNAKAQEILDAYHTPLMEMTSAEKQLEAAALMEKYQALQIDGRQIQKNLFQAARDNAEFLDDEEKVEFLGTPKVEDGKGEGEGSGGGGSDIPEDPNAALAEVAAPAQEPQEAKLPVEKLADWVAPTAGRERSSGINAFDLVKPTKAYQQAEEMRSPIDINQIAAYQKKLLDAQPQDIKSEMAQLVAEKYGPKVFSESQKAFYDPKHPQHQAVVLDAFALLQDIWRRRKGLPNTPPVPQDDAVAPLP